MDVADLRKNYQAGELRRGDLAANPFEQFGRWFKTACETPSVLEANAMTLSTAGKDGLVSSRTVLLKGWSEHGFVFFTNLGSRKARQMAEHPQVALLFCWLPLERQVGISGTIERTTPKEDEDYFHSRPLASQLGAWASKQGEVVSSRAYLEKKFLEAREEFCGGEVPLPPFWGGYRVIPQAVEFWQGRRDRLHDRFQFTRMADGWQIDRLSP